MDSRKRVLGSDSQEVSLAYAREQLQEKNRTDTPTNRQNGCLLCFTCISDGFPKTNYKHGQLMHQREKLKDHYKNHHPTDVPQDWTLTSDNNAPPKKQPKINFFTNKKSVESIIGRPSTNTAFGIHEKTSIVAKFSEDESEPSTQTSPSLTIENLQGDTASIQDEAITTDTNVVTESTNLVSQE